jgi:hypothetical protein
MLSKFQAQVTVHCIFVTVYVQNFSQKQLKERYFGILFMDRSIFVLWTRENFDS